MCVHKTLKKHKRVQAVNNMTINRVWCFAHPREEMVLGYK